MPVDLGLHHFSRWYTIANARFYRFDPDIQEMLPSTPLHHVTYALAKFEVAMSNSLGGDAFTRKYIY